jgi:hypothetical protein
MPPIPVHIDDPITPQKAKGVTPQTPGSAGSSAHSGTTTTQEQRQPQAYPPARPGAVAGPAPTPYILSPQPIPSRTVPASALQDGPPPPQPGAVPVPPGQLAVSSTLPPASGLPPPPKAGETVKQPQTTPYSPPPQMSVPPPQRNYAPTHSTSTSISSLQSPRTPNRNVSGRTTYNFGAVPDGAGHHRRVSSEHPPGYQQNIYAQEMTPEQRASLDQETRRESFVDKFGLGGDGDGRGGSPGGLGGGDMGETVGKAWEGAKGLLSAAGKQLADAEEKAWRWANGKS